jgi:hypothetical protein
MTYSPTAKMLAEGIETSGLTQREIADRVNFKHKNMITMMKQGLTRVPLDRIPALGQTLGSDQATLLLTAIKEYHRGAFDVLCDTLGLLFTKTEMELVVMFRMATLSDEIELDGSFRKALEGLLELAADNARR